MPPKHHLPPGATPLYLIDGSSFIYRGFYAMGDLTRADGFPTNALFIVLRLALRLLREEKLRYAAFVVDGRGPSFRADIFPAYKAQRQKMPEPLAQQIDPIMQGMRLLGFPVLRLEGVEADDTIASLTERFKTALPVVIVGSDKDLRQCLDHNVVLWDPSGKQEKIVTLQTFKEEFPPGPAYWPDFQALTGDSSDNIPGVPGVGPKTALDVTAQFPSLEALRQGIADLKPALRGKIEPHMEDLFVYRELTRLRRDVAQDAALSALEVTPAPVAEIVAFLTSYELRSLAREAQAWGAAGTPQKAGCSQAAAHAPNTGPERLGLLDVAAVAQEGSPHAPPAPAGTQNGEPADALAPAEGGSSGKPSLRAGGQLSLLSQPAARPQERSRPETYTTAAALPSLTGRSVAIVAVDEGFLIASEGREWLTRDSAATLAPLLAQASRVAMPSYKELLAADAHWERVPLSACFDVSLAAYLLQPEDRLFSWERLLDRLWSDPGFTPDQAPGGSWGLSCLALSNLLSARLEQAGLAQLMRSLEMPLVPVLVAMEKLGIRIDKQAFAAFASEVNARLEELTRIMHREAGMQFNIRSSQQLADVLFNRLGLKAPSKTPGGAASTSAEVLERLSGQHPLVELILEYRKLEKLRSTYLEPLPALTDPSQRIHTTFNQLATATGRLSSSAPNLQNIPVRGELGRRMRGLFTAAEGMLLASADYSQIELRVLAHFSADPELLQAFRENQDIHTRTAALLFDTDQPAVTPGQRRQAKTINFGLLYGMGPQKLSRELGLTLAQAKDFIARYFERLSVLKKYYQTVVEQAKEQGFVTTLAGRRRMLPDIRSRNAQLEAQAKRQAVNTVIQGSAADIIKMAMLAVQGDERLHSLGARLLLQVHDELLLEAPGENAQSAGDRLRELMTGVVRLDVPLTADLGLGKDWGGAH